jgi:uncharacterized membrane protein YgcG
VTQPQSFKVCPQCQQPTALNTVLCATCGRRFQSTAPPVNRTQVFTPGAMPSPTQPLYPPMPNAPMAAPHAGGPRDQVEWMSSCIWNWIALFFVTTSLCFSVRLMFDRTAPDDTRGYALMFCLGLGSLFSFLVLRLRRLYIYFAFRRYRWWIPALIVAGLVGLMLFADNERRYAAYHRYDSYRSNSYDNPSPNAQRMPVYFPPASAMRSNSSYTAPPYTPNTTNHMPRGGFSGAGSSTENNAPTRTPSIGDGATFGGGFGESPPYRSRQGFGGGGLSSGGFSGGGTPEKNRQGFGGGGRGGF